MMVAGLWLKGVKMSSESGDNKGSKHIKVSHRNIVHTRESAVDGILLVGDAENACDLRPYFEMSIKDIIIHAAYRGRGY